jgi:hypothetical protein
MKFKLGDLVKKVSGSEWHGTVVGTYSTELTPEGYAVESSTEKGSVQIYPAKALESWSDVGLRNERIRELTEQCRGNPMTSEFEPRFNKEKFAELIVRECVGVCEEYHGTAGDQAAQYIGQGIKEHFGVEE